MPRFIADHIDLDAGYAVITGPDALHIHRVLRLKREDPLEITDGSGTCYESIADSLSASEIRLRLVRQTADHNESSCRITLCQGVLKEKKIDTLLWHLTELGIHEFQPFYCERSIPVHDEKRVSSRLKRWETIAREALKQCRRSCLPIVNAPVNYTDMIQCTDRFDLRLACWEGQAGEKIRFPSPETDQPLKRLMIIIGPEGGFTGKEIETARNHGVRILSIGPRILRSQTAAIAACTLAQHYYGDM